MDRFVAISGCSGGGKSTLLDELAKRGYGAVEEPGRRIVKQEMHGDGARLPWVDIAAFAQSALDLALDDHRKAAKIKGIVFFDRGIVDAAAALVHFNNDKDAAAILQTRHYNRNVFLTPPWPEIHQVDAERRHSFDEALAEYDRLIHVYSNAGYAVHILPKVTVTERADFLLGILHRL